MNEMIQAIINRRSIRQYTPAQITEKELQWILTAGEYAPSGGNCQLARFTVIQDPTMLAELNQLMNDAFRNMVIVDGMYKSLVSAIKKAQAAWFDYFYQAPTLIIVSNHTLHLNAMADSSAAIENMLLAASSMGLGSCWINQIRWLTDHEHMRAFFQRIGITDDESVFGSLVVGYPAQAIPEPPPRKEGRVKIFK